MHLRTGIIIRINCYLSNFNQKLNYITQTITLQGSLDNYGRYIVTNDKALFGLINNQLSIKRSHPHYTEFKIVGSSPAGPAWLDQNFGRR